MRLTLFSRVAVFFGVLATTVSVSGQNIEWHVTTDRLDYRSGDDVTFPMEACNTGPSVSTVNMNVAPLAIDADDNPNCAFVAVAGAVVLRRR